MLLEEFDSNRFAVINPDMCADKIVVVKLFCNTFG